MVRPKKVVAGIRPKEEDSPNAADGSLMVQSRSRRTIKPNPKYNSKEIIPLKRIGSGDEDEDEDELDHSQNTEDDEDFRDDGARDSDVEETPPSKRRGRPRALEAPRSEPQPQRRLQQIRAGLKEQVTLSASKIMQQSGLGALDKKRKIDYDAVEEPSAKRRPGMPTGTPISTRTGGRLTTMSSSSQGLVATPKGGKENASVVKKHEDQVKIMSVEKILNKAPAATKLSPGGIITRRQQATTVSPAATTVTKTPVTKAAAAAATGIVRSQVVIGSGGKEPVSRSMIQVRRPTPMSSTSQTSPAAPQKTLTPPVPRERVLLNRTPVVKPKPAAPVSAQTTARPLTATRAIVRNSPQQTKSPVNRILNANATTTAITTKSHVVPAGAEVEPLSDGNRTRVTTIEKRFVIWVQPEEEADEGEEDTGKASVSLLKLRADIKNLKMPTEQWSYQMKLHTRRGAADPTVDVPDKPGYFLQSVVLNRQVPATGSPKLLNGQKVDLRQFDRSVELLKNQYNVTIDGRAVKLVGAPTQVTDREDVEALLEIVNHVSLDSPVVTPMTINI